MLKIATKSDISWIVELSYEKRLTYSKHQPNFWKMSENSNAVQEEWFESEIENPKVIALADGEKQGFIMGKIITPPEVYDAGLTLMIDDFCVKNENLWQTLGREMLNECIKIGKTKGVVQVLVVSGDHDMAKNKLLEDMNLAVASRWYTAKA
ncbi:GNAT family N-acetyltransferase [Candidatus Deianiraea vastatrix]|uniref:N-acetyltransferase n=1 Tax=Candidatus Deianiraea vastatrix TaxID=2163644 RepID=A0A5B8XIR0_9RICK|nr:GNAT family N-acetyltransferase [Candidatus Deianiraea vastatrix]QED23861.1 Putative N-acetyltransferase [Candidatus Deianiraea vastatrix]